MFLIFLYKENMRIMEKIAEMVSSKRRRESAFVLSTKCLVIVSSKSYYVNFDMLTIKELA